MNLLSSRRSALGACAAAIILVGCGGSQPIPEGQSSAFAGLKTQQVRPAHKSKSSDLFYASTRSRKVFVATYPQGKYVGTLHVSGGTTIGLCSDKNGNVFVPVQNSSGTATIYEFNHDGHKINRLSDPGPAMGCSVDPTTGNLAVANAKSGVAVYANAQGDATLLTSSAAYSCTYDDSGNLFVRQSYNVVGLGEYPTNGNFQSISFKKPIGDGNDHGTNIQWDGKYVAVTYVSSHGAITVYRVKVSGSSGTVASTITLESKKKHDRGYDAISWIQGKKIMMPISQDGKHLGMWGYPKGGKIDDSIPARGFRLVGVTVSVGS
jgi:hypothetical protein